MRLPSPLPQTLVPSASQIGLYFYFHPPNHTYLPTHLLPPNTTYLQTQLPVSQPHRAQFQFKVEKEMMRCVTVRSANH